MQDQKCKEYLKVRNISQIIILFIIIQKAKQKYKFNMQIKDKRQELTPWQTKQQNIFALQLVSQVSQSINSQPVQQKTIKLIQKKQVKQKKRLSTIQSIFRLKTQRQADIKQFIINSRKKQKNSVREVRPLNRNLISIINTYQDQANKINSQNYSKKIGVKKISKDLSKLDRIQRNFSTQNIKRKQQIVRIDIKKLKQVLFEKRNPSLQTLIKTKQQLEKMNLQHQSPILRTYSVHNIQMNAMQEKSAIIQKLGNIRKRKNSNDFNETQALSRVKDTIKKESIEKRPRLKSSINSSRGHVIDRLFDKFS